MDSDLADKIASEIFETYSQLPSKAKPLVRSNGVKEWTILAGVVMMTSNSNLRCVSIGTGVKVLPDDMMKSCNGEVLHDMHAEILALRAFNRFVIDECSRVSLGEESDLIEPVTDSEPPVCKFLFKMKLNVKLFLYVSEAPCGDSSMGCLRAETKCTESWTDPIIRVGETDLNTSTGKSYPVIRDREMDPVIRVETTVHGSIGQSTIDNICPNNTRPVRGRDHFDIVGLVRTKPGRRDSPVTYSKSCSDKLALRQFTSILCGILARIVNPEHFYLSGLVVPLSQLNSSDFTRAFSKEGRLRNYTKYKFQFKEYQPHFFSYLGTRLRFENSKEAIPHGKPCFKSIVWSSWHPCEAILGGVQMGSKPFSGKGYSIYCRKELTLQVLKLASCQSIDSYLCYKQTNSRTTTKQIVYEILGGWLATSNDDFGVCVCT